MHERLVDRIEKAAGSRPRDMRAIPGGCIADIFRVDLDSGETVVVKVAGAEGNLEIEAWMLRYLATHSALPVPSVIHADTEVLVMEYIETSGGIAAAEQENAATLLAALHEVTGPAFGLERDTLIGPLPQPNPETTRWIDFFREHRLLYMARQAHGAGRIADPLLRRIEDFASRLGDWLEEPALPSLIHGDMWGGNVLTRGGRIAAFIDPAIYYADPEIELAFSTLFATFGEPFFRRYADIRGLRDGFFEVRRDIYNLYPLLVHARLFGGGYASAVDGILERRGF